MAHALQHFFGLDDLSGAWYGFWSGAGSCLTYLGVFVGAWHHLNCHQSGCWRLGRHQAGQFKVCAKHHPAIAGKVTAQHIATAHEESIT